MGQKDQMRIALIQEPLLNMLLLLRLHTPFNQHGGLTSIHSYFSSNVDYIFYNKYPSIHTFILRINPHTTFLLQRAFSSKLMDVFMLFSEYHILSAFMFL